MAATPAHSPRAPTAKAGERERRGRAFLLIRTGLALSIVALLVRFVVVPQWHDAARALSLVSAVSAPLLLAGVALELLSLCALAGLTWIALDPATRPRFLTVLHVDLAGVGVTNAIPGGGATSLAVRYRMLTRRRTPGSAVVAGVTAEVVISNLTLGLLFALGLATSVAALPTAPYYRIAGAFVGGVFGTAAVLLGLAALRPSRTVRLVRAATGSLPGRASVRITRSVAHTVRAVRRLAASPRRFAAAVGFAVANWLLDIAALLVMFAAFGAHPPIAPLLLVYALANILALLSITPGGVGIVEGVMVPAFVALALPHGVAVLGVTAWRLVEYWMPMPLAALSAIALTVRGALARWSARVERGDTLYRGRDRGVYPRSRHS
ncbi:lysylphosphatidylglycerol synthase transmembrane domain-containing protein [Humibacter sp.]|uniref:lysylphosphatidylglycerol synthase transmembrane domain-containing protein n=1 Tax=Humibacter sp. TaxID=1940291 RepID=UPI003F7D618B